MNRRLQLHRLALAIVFFAALMGLTLGTSCPPGGDLNPSAPYGNRPPRIMITSVSPTSVEVGGSVTVNFTGDDGEDAAAVRVFASKSANPSPAEEIPIPVAVGSSIGPGSGSGNAVWDTTGISEGSYNIFAEIDDRTYDAATNTGNPAVRTTAASPVVISAAGGGGGGNTHENGAPTIEITLPATSVAATSEDVLTLQYRVKDPDSDIDTLTLTYFLDKTQGVTNDPLNPSIQIGNYSISAGTVAPNTFSAYISESIPIDTSKVPIRRETDEGGRPLPYYVRVRADDGKGGVVESYAVGVLRIMSPASDVVDLLQVGTMTAGATFQGFYGDPLDLRQGGRLGNAFAPLGDLDGDGLADFAMSAETASPYNSPRTGEMYIVYGRRREVNPSGDPLTNQGRLTGVINTNTIGTFVPLSPEDPRHNKIFNIRGHVMPNTSFGSGSDGLGLTSIARISDLTGDGRPEILVGAPYNLNLPDWEDLDPCDSCTYGSSEAGTFSAYAGIATWLGGTPGGIQTTISAVMTPSEYSAVYAGSWIPTFPDYDNELRNVKFNADLNGQRITNFTNVRLHVTGKLERKVDLDIPVKVAIDHYDRNSQIGPVVDGVLYHTNLTDPNSPTGDFEGYITIYPLGACCLLDGSCTVESSDSCYARNNNSLTQIAFYMGDNTTCEYIQNIGAAPIGGACCINNNGITVCSLATPDECARKGVYHGDGLVCPDPGDPNVPNPCHIPMTFWGACCKTDGTCQSMSEGDCATNGGTYTKGMSCTDVANVTCATSIPSVPNVPALPVGPSSMLPPSAYDGRFTLFMQPSGYPGAAKLSTVELIVQGIGINPVTYPIAFTYYDGLPPTFSNTVGCVNAAVTSPPANPYALARLEPTCGMSGPEGAGVNRGGERSVVRRSRSCDLGQHRSWCGRVLGESGRNADLQEQSGRALRFIGGLPE